MGGLAKTKMKIMDANGIEGGHSTKIKSIARSRKNKKIKKRKRREIAQSG